MFRTKLALLSIVATLALVSSITAFDLHSPSNVDHYPIQSSCSEAINDQVNWELYAAITYLNMYGYFNNPEVARYGYADFFKDQADEEFNHAKKFIEYVNKRNGTIESLKVHNSLKSSWNSPLEALEDAINLEKSVYARIQHIHTIAEQKCLDAHLTDFLEGYFFTEQVDSINELHSMRTKLQSATEPAALQTLTYLEDKRLLKTRQEL